MFGVYCLKEFKLAKRNMFFLLLIILPVLTSLAGVALTNVYSETPKIVLLEGDQRAVPEEVTVVRVPDDESMIKRVEDIDFAIGISGEKIVTDGRESEAATAAAERIAVGNAPENMEKMPEETKRKILSFALFAAFTGATALILKLVEEREYNTVDLYKTEPSPDLYPVGAKLLVSSVLGAVAFIFSVWILKTPADFWTLAILYILGMGLGSILMILVAYASENQSQAIAVLKPVALFVMILPPSAGLIFGGILHKIALVTPFYWLLQFIYSIYNGAVSWQYLIALSAAVIVGSLIIIFTWYRSPYGRKRSDA
ncbi:MAG: ABC transporter permease [Peptococcaceae bacterium]